MCTDISFNIVGQLFSGTIEHKYVVLCVDASGTTMCTYYSSFIPLSLMHMQS